MKDNDEEFVNHTYGGFKASFYAMQGRYPTEQEIFSAGMRGGLDLTKARLGDTEPFIRSTTRQFEILVDGVWRPADLGHLRQGDVIRFKDEEDKTVYIATSDPNVMVDPYEQNQQQEEQTI